MVQLYTTTAYQNVQVVFDYLIYGCILLKIDLSSETNKKHILLLSLLNLIDLVFSVQCSAANI